MITLTVITLSDFHCSNTWYSFNKNNNINEGKVVLKLLKCYYD
jgi:hypothetical protein